MTTRDMVWRRDLLPIFPVVTAMDNNNVALVFWTRLVFFFFPGAILVWAWILLGCLG